MIQSVFHHFTGQCLQHSLSISQIRSDNQTALSASHPENTVITALPPTPHSSATRRSLLTITAQTKLSPCAPSAQVGLG